MSLKPRIEAVLFLTDKPMAAAAIAQIVNVDVQTVRQTILELIHDYEERNSALEIADDGGYMMQAKDEYANFANDMAPIDLPIAMVRTLSAIAIKQPVLQSEIVRIRGAGAYDHIKELLEKELITKKEEGRSALLGTTKKFQEYFRLSQDAKALRDQLKEQSKTEPVAAEQQLTTSDIVVGESLASENPIAEIAAAVIEDDSLTPAVDSEIALVEKPSVAEEPSGVIEEDDTAVVDSTNEFAATGTL